MPTFKNYLLKSLNKEYKHSENPIPLTTISLEIIEEYPNINITETLHDIQNEIKTTTNIIVKLFGMLTILVLKLNHVAEEENIEEILNTVSQIKEVEKEINLMI